MVIVIKVLFVMILSTFILKQTVIIGTSYHKNQIYYTAI